MRSHDLQFDRDHLPRWTCDSDAAATLGFSAGKSEAVVPAVDAPMLWHMNKAATAVALLLACSSSGEGLERLPPPPPLASSLPMPPPPQTSSQPPPVKIAAFLREHATDTSAWRATVYEIANGDNDRRGRSAEFRGRRIVRQAMLSDADAAELAARLGRDDSYTNGDYGCFVDPASGYRLERGDALLDFMVNCGHVSFDGVEWHAASLSSGMMQFLDRLGRTPKRPRHEPTPMPRSGGERSTLPQGRMTSRRRGSRHRRIGSTQTGPHQRRRPR